MTRTGSGRAVAVAVMLSTLVLVPGSPAEWSVSGQTEPSSEFDGLAWMFADPPGYHGHRVYFNGLPIHGYTGANPNTAATQGSLVVPGQPLPQTPLILSEKHAGTIFWGGGAKVFGTDIGVKFKATAGGSNENLLKFVVEPNHDGKYLFWWVAGDRGSNPARGMVGAAWEIE